MHSCSALQDQPCLRAHLLLLPLSLSMLSLLSLIAAGLMSTPTTLPCLPASMAAHAAMKPQPQPTSSTLHAADQHQKHQQWVSALQVCLAEIRHSVA